VALTAIINRNHFTCETILSLYHFSSNPEKLKLIARRLRHPVGPHGLFWQKNINYLVLPVYGYWIYLGRRIRGLTLALRLVVETSEILYMPIKTLFSWNWNNALSRRSFLRKRYGNNNVLRRHRRGGREGCVLENVRGTPCVPFQGVLLPTGRSLGGTQPLSRQCWISCLEMACSWCVLAQCYEIRMSALEPPKTVLRLQEQSATVRRQIASSSCA